MALRLAASMVCNSHPIYFYQPIPKNACSSIKMEIFRRRFGFNFPEIQHWRRHGAFIHIHQLMPTRRAPPPAGEKCLIVVRNPVRRFESAFREKILFNEDFTDLRSLKQRVRDIIGQVRSASYENRILRDHFRPQYYWVAPIRPEDRFLVDCRQLGRFLNLRSTRANDSRLHTGRSRNVDLVKMLAEIVVSVREELQELYTEDELLVAKANNKPTYSRF